MSRQTHTWLVTTKLTDAQDREFAVLGKATYDEEGDLLTVATRTPTKGLREATQGGQGTLQALAKQLLRELIRDALTRS